MSVSRIRLSVYLRVALQSFTFDSATHRIFAIPLNVVKSLRVESEVVAQMYLYFHDICRNRSIAHQIRLTTGAGVSSVSIHPIPSSQNVQRSTTQQIGIFLSRRGGIIQKSATP